MAASCTLIVPPARVGNPLAGQRAAAMPDARHTLFFSKPSLKKWMSRVGDSALLCESMRFPCPTPTETGPLSSPCLWRSLGTIHPTAPFHSATPEPAPGIIFPDYFKPCLPRLPALSLRMPSQPSAALLRHPHRDPSSSSPPSNPETSSNPPPDQTDGSQGRLATSAASSASELSSLEMRLHSALRQFPDFPSPGILFEDILPIFQNPELHHSLLRALEISIHTTFHHKPDVVVGLEARGFLFGPSLALRMGSAFVPVRKKGKLPGPVHTAVYQKEYGEDFFQIQQDAIKPGQRVVVVDDIIATGTFHTTCMSF